MVGVSRDPKDFSRRLFREMYKRGYDTVAVNPHTNEWEVKPCFARLPDVKPPVEGALLMTSPKETETVARECAEAGVRPV